MDFPTDSMIKCSPYPHYSICSSPNFVICNLFVIRYIYLYVLPTYEFQTYEFQMNLNQTTEDNWVLGINFLMHISQLFCWIYNVL